MAASACSVRSASPRELLVCSFTSCRKAVNSSTSCSSPTGRARRRLGGRSASSGSAPASCAGLFQPLPEAVEHGFVVEPVVHRPSASESKVCVGIRAVRRRRRTSAMIPASVSADSKSNNFDLQPHHRIAELLVGLVNLRKTLPGRGRADSGGPTPGSGGGPRPRRNPGESPRIA